MLVQVSPSLNIYESLTYNIKCDEHEIKVGQRVIIPIAKRMTSGWITEKGSDYTGRVRNVIGIVKDEYFPEPSFMTFARTVSSLYFTSVGMILDSSLSPKKKSTNNLCFEKDGKPDKFNKYPQTELQKLFENELVTFFYKDSIVPSEPSGHPTEENLIAPPGKIPEHSFIISYQREVIYQELIKTYLEKGQSVLITTPDNLTAEYLKTALEHVDVYHSGIKLKDRELLWNDYSKGKVGVVAGGLTAAFLPIKNLGCIICDRAGSSVYKRTFYSSFDIQVLSKLRARSSQIPLVQGFSSFTVETWKNKDHILLQDHRKEEHKGVSVNVQMLKAREKQVPGELIEIIKDLYLNKKKCLIIINKKDSANFLFCEKCKSIQKCPNCNKYLKVDDETNVECPKCRFKKEQFSLCPKCNNSLSRVNDISQASVKKLIKKEVVEKGILTLNPDLMKDIDALLKQLKDSPIVLASPIIVNPSFKDLFDAIIYIRPESLFNMNEHNAAEMVFSTISELKEIVKKNGTIDVFSSFHFHYSLKLILQEEEFFNRELKYREWFLLPPFQNVYHIEIRETGDIRKLAKKMRTLHTRFHEQIKIKKIYLCSRKKQRGNFKGILEAHTSPDTLQETGLLQQRNIHISLEQV